MTDSSKTPQRPWFSWIVASVLLAGPLGAQLVCDGAPEGFAQGVPAGWSAVDASGGGLAWTALAVCGEGANYTGGAGGAACASSDRFGLGPFDAELRSPLVDLSAAAEPVLRFKVNYQNFAAADRLDVDVSTDLGASWTTALSLAEDYGVFRATPGETVEVDLAAFAGQSALTLRFRYVDPEADAFDWYAQIDDVALSCNVPACATPPVSGLVADGGFEGGTPSAAWSEGSAAFDSPICTGARCGFAGARGGEAWAFLGGAPAAGTDFLEQDVTLPFGIATLSFYLWIPAVSGDGADALRVLVDGQQVFAAGEDSARFRPGYRRVDVDVSDFADGGVHRLRFESTSAGASGHTSFFVDDATAEVCTAVVANPGISIDDVALDEGNAGRRDAVFTVSLAGASRDPVTVDFATADSSARVSDHDYVAVSGTLTFPRGVVTRTIAVPVVGDVVDEPSEAFVVNLSNAVGGVIVDGQGFGTLFNELLEPPCDCQ